VFVRVYISNHLNKTSTTANYFLRTFNYDYEKKEQCPSTIMRLPITGDYEKYIR